MMAIVKKVFSICSIMACALILLGATALGSISYQLRETFTYNDVSGDTDSSFLEPGLKLTQDFSIRTMGATDSGWRYRGNLSLRNVMDLSGSDYGRIDVRNYRLSLTRAPIDWNIGKVYADFGQYLMTQSLTGAVFNDGGTDLSVAAGVSRAYVPGRSLERLALGAIKGFELDNPLSNKPGLDKVMINAGISYVSDSERSAEPINPEESRVLFLGTQTALWSDMDLHISVASSMYDPDKTSGAGGVEGLAAKAEMIYNLPGLMWQAGIERVSPQFRNLSSPMSADRLELYTRARMSLTEALRVDASYRNYRDNLDLDKAITTTNQLFNMMFNQTWVDSRNRELIYGIRGRSVTTDDNSTNTLSLTGEVQFRDRIGDLDYRLEISNNWRNNIINPDANKNLLSGTVDLKGSYYFMDMPADPFFNIKIENDMPVSGQPDTTYTANLGSRLRIDYDNSINASVRYLFLDRPGDADDMTKTTTRITYIRDMPAGGSSLELSAEAVDTIYNDESKNYQELVATVIYTINF